MAITKEEVIEMDQVQTVTEQEVAEQENQVQEAEKQYSGFEVIGERGEFGYLGRIWHHDNLELETAIMLVKAGYPFILLV